MPISMPFIGRKLNFDESMHTGRATYLDHSTFVQKRWLHVMIMSLRYVGSKLKQMCTHSFMIAQIDSSSPDSRSRSAIIVSLLF